MDMGGGGSGGHHADVVAAVAASLFRVQSMGDGTDVSSVLGTDDQDCAI
jgi:hypothetical protein